MSLQLHHLALHQLIRKTQDELHLQLRSFAARR